MRRTRRRGAALILFVVDQVGSAEYLLPLLARWREHPREAWRLLASPRSSAAFSRHGVPHEPATSANLSQHVAALDEWTPRVGMLSSSGDSELEHVFRSALKQRRIPCFQFVDMWANYALRFHAPAQGGPPLHLPDAVLTIDENARHAMISEGIPDSIIRVIGQPYFEAIQARYQARAADRARGNRVLIATQPVSRYHGRRLGYDEHDFLRCCLEALQRSAIGWERVDVAIHPEESRDRHLAELARISNRIDVVDGAGLFIDDYAAVLSMNSSFLVHALLAGVAVASVQPGALADEFCQLAALGMIPRWTEVAQLSEWLDNVDVFQASAAARPPTLMQHALAGSCDRFEHFLLAARP